MSTTISHLRSLPIRVLRVCVALLGADAAEMIEKAEALVRENSFFEFRLDYLPDPVAALPKIRRFLEMHPEAVCIATCRRVPNGGKFRGSPSAQIAVLTKAAATGFQFVDVEIETAQAIKLAEYEKLRAVAGIVLSFHDFQGTPPPGELREIVERMIRHGADVAKIVTFARSWEDNLKILSLSPYAQKRGQAIVTFCMGEKGKMSRIFSPLMGAAWTYASLSRTRASAPGQLTVAEMREIWERLP